jgi:hypothetical protein
MGKTLTIEAAINGHHCWWLAPTYGMASHVWRDIKTALARNRHRKISEAERRIDLRGGGSISIRSTHTPDYLRGAGLDFAVLDEAAFMPSNVWSEVVRPMLVERRGNALFLSTPRGLNWFWDIYRIGLDPEEPEWVSFQMSSYDNPLIDPHELDTIRRSTPDRVFREEYLAEFISDSGRVFRGVREAAVAPASAQPDPSHRYVAGIDWGRDSDYTCIAIIDTEAKALVAFDRFNQIGWELQRGRLKALCEHWQPLAVWAEANSIGSVNIEALQAEGLPVRPFQTTAKSKSPLIEALALAIERREIALLPDEVLLNELTAYTIERLPGGGYRYTAPSGGHDDSVIALALAWHGIQYGGASVDFA